MVDPRQIIQGLIQRGVPPAAAVGMAGNIAVESGFNPGINEIAPLVPGSRGGFGLIQWTGPRRRALEAYAGAQADNPERQLDFLVQELNTTEKSARDAIYAAQDPETAARLVSDKFLRPGIPHLDRRIAEARKLAGMVGGEASQQPPQGLYAGLAVNNGYQPNAPQQASQQPPQNALAQIQQPQYQNALNVADFLMPTQTNALTRRLT